MTTAGFLFPAARPYGAKDCREARARRPPPHEPGGFLERNRCENRSAGHVGRRLPFQLCLPTARLLAKEEGEEEDRRGET